MGSVSSTIVTKVVGPTAQSNPSTKEAKTGVSLGLQETLAQNVWQAV